MSRLAIVVHASLSGPVLGKKQLGERTCGRRGDGLYADVRRALGIQVWVSDRVH